MSELKASVGDKVVTVQTLRVDGKKMSLQFLKQVPAEDWLDEQLEQRKDITVWGSVKYKLPDGGTDWLLVQVGDQLRRCSFERPSDYRGLFDMYQGWLTRDQETVKRLTSELAAKQCEVDAEERQGIKQILEGSRDRLQQSLADAKRKVIEREAEVQREQDKLDRAATRRARYDDLAPSVQQLFLG